MQSQSVGPIPMIAMGIKSIQHLVRHLYRGITMTLPKYATVYCESRSFNTALEKQF